jgi:hypothetical protein
MDFSGSVFSTLSLGKKKFPLLCYTDYVLLLISITVYGNMDALDLANYIAIACFDMGILFLYYFFEWYQSKYGANDTEKEEDLETASSQNTEVVAVDEVSSVKQEIK